MTPMNPEPSAALVEVKVKQVLEDSNTDTKIVVLKNEDGSETLPIWVGASEGQAIRLAMDHAVSPRPMSHDLIRSFADHLEVTIQHVVLTDVKSSTYYATIHVASKGVDRTLDARPSDAIALALRATRPIYVTRDVLSRRTAANLDAWVAKLETKNIET